jgi:1,5-anhydro-D-fructose reductase (1,5-anhydro-D-mannitol-forming)
MKQAGDAAGRAIGWGIIGCGDVVARKSGPAIASLPNQNIVAVMRRDATAAARFAERFAVPRWTTDAAALIADTGVDAVYIATPPAHHLEYAEAVAAAGKPCLIEKPAGRSEYECRRIVEVFRHAGVPLYVAYYRRDLEKFQAVKRIVASGQLGSIVAINYRFAKPADPGDWRQQPERSGGGRFFDLAGHVLDLFDDWFGPLELTGSAVANRLPGHDTEDAVTLSFRTPDGAVGTASWNFAAPSHVDELVVDGLAGRVRLAAMAPGGAVRVEPTDAALTRASRSRGERAWRQLKARLHVPTRRTVRFGRERQVHAPMFERIAGDLLARNAPATPTAALRTSALLNAALSDHYGGRCGAFWETRGQWRSLRRRAERDVQAAAGYRLTPAEVAQFDARGFIGPFRCDADWQHVIVPIKKGTNLHLGDPATFDVCAHPSIACRADQLLGSRGIALFKSRFVVKLPAGGATVAWHQDVGDTNGGYFPDGEPVPSITCWLALDRASAASGALRVIPGTHKHLYGDYRARLRARLVEDGAINEELLNEAVTLELEAGEFYLFHSWVLHGSPPNATSARRAGLNARFVRRGDEYERDCVYLSLG